MANFAYKQTTNTTLKAVGYIDTDAGTITVDEVAKSLKTLLSDFNGAYGELTFKVKSEKDLDEPIDMDEE